MVCWPIVRRTLRSHRRGIFGWTLGILALVIIQLAVYPTIRSSATDWSSLTDQFPDAFKKMFRMEDYASERGYLSTELLSFTLPFIVIGLGCTWGARLVTEEEELATADIMLSLPISRTTYITSRFIAAATVMVFALTVFTVALLIGTRWLGMSIPVHQYVSAAFSLLCIGLLMMTLAAALGAWIGKRSGALGISMATAIALFVLYSLGPLVDFLDKLIPYNPMQWTIGSAPLFDGTSLGYTVAIVAVIAPCVAATYVLFDRRDIVG
jgi:ABC-2 type transport system permease protein